MQAPRLCAPWIGAILGSVCLAAGCGGDGNNGLFGSGDAGDESAGEGGPGSGSGNDSTGSATAGDDGGTRYDVDPGESADGGEGPGGSCKADPGMEGTPEECNDKAPPGSFEPDIQWTWDGPNGDRESAVSPLVANFTDDDGDGDISLCDVPDLVVVSAAMIAGGGVGNMYLLDGATGTVHFQFAAGVDATVTPALGDIDGDGLPEVVTAYTAALGFTDRLIAFEHDGSVKWMGTSDWAFTEAVYSAIALADLDNDGDVEILAGSNVFDHQGTLLFNAPITYLFGTGSATAAADLDEDGDLEVVFGNSAFHHDASAYYDAPISPGYPQIADLDGDSRAEVLVMNGDGIAVLEHDGTVKYQGLAPTGDVADGGTNWLRPATIHDFDGDDVSEFAVSSANHYTVYEGDATIVWSAVVSDQSGIAAGTAFDFLGDGVAEAMYADEHKLFIYDGSGTPVLEIPRSSGTIIEYPVVADIDNDGSAEIVVVSNFEASGGPQTAPTVQVIRDKSDRWIQARRIWNQHTYHVTNVEEDGRIPQNEKPSWKYLNTFRTNAQIEDGGVCRPTPEG